MKIEGWEGLLTGYLFDAHKRMFVWGENDCALWIGEWVKLATGNTWVDDWRGTYKTEAGALRKIRARGHQDLNGLIASYLEETIVTKAQRGDIVMNSQGCAGICNGRLAHFLTTNGVTNEPALGCVSAWRVG